MVYSRCPHHTHSSTSTSCGKCDFCIFAIGKLQKSHFPQVVQAGYTPFKGRRDHTPLRRPNGLIMGYTPPRNIVYIIIKIVKQCLTCKKWCIAGSLSHTLSSTSTSCGKCNFCNLPIAKIQKLHFPQVVQTGYTPFKGRRDHTPFNGLLVYNNGLYTIKLNTAK